jgi:hypothetical protein
MGDEPRFVVAGEVVEQEFGILRLRCAPLRMTGFCGANI